MMIKTFLDNYYFDKKNIVGDTKLVFLTILSIFFPKAMTIYSSEIFLKLYYEKSNNIYNVPLKAIREKNMETKEHILGSN